METLSLQSCRIYLFVSGFPSIQGRIQEIASETPSLQSCRIYLFVSGFPSIQGRIHRCNKRVLSPLIAEAIMVFSIPPPKKNPFWVKLSDKCHFRKGVSTSGTPLGFENSHWSPESCMFDHPSFYFLSFASFLTTLKMNTQIQNDLNDLRGSISIREVPEAEGTCGQVLRSTSVDS